MTSSNTSWADAKRASVVGYVVRDASVVFYDGPSWVEAERVLDRAFLVSKNGPVVFDVVKVSSVAKAA